MDTIEACAESIERQLKQLERDIEVPEIRNLDKILNQQDDIEALIERDGYIDSLKKSIAENGRFIETIRKSCTQLNLKSLKDRQELFEAHSKEVSCGVVFQCSLHEISFSLLAPYVYAHIHSVL